jgi:hypothetical protein
MTHDPSEHIRGLQQLLISDKKKIAFLFGAGTSLAENGNDENLKTIPAIGKMTEEIETELIKDYDKSTIEEIKEEIGEKYTVETLLSNIEQKCQLLGKGKFNGLDKIQFEDLRTKIKAEIRKKVSIHKDIDANKLIHTGFAEWIGRADRKQAVEIFTTNYDYLFELGLECKSIPYYDGFTGSYQPFFDSNSVEDLHFSPLQTKLWKIHGSLGWHYDETSKKVLRKDSNSDDMLIYPSTLKYDESRKQPYIALGDRLTNFLKEPDTILITCDIHLATSILMKEL